jgi:hypothetical protein
MLWKVPFVALLSFLAGFGFLHVSVLLESYLTLAAGIILLLVGSAILIQSPNRARITRSATPPGDNAAQRPDSLS